MKTKHTPGPWDCSTSDDTQSFPLDVWVMVAMPRRYMKIATVYQTGVPGEAQANAVLIAAAPETRARALDAEARLRFLERKLLAAEQLALACRPVIEGDIHGFALERPLFAYDEVKHDG